MALENLCRPGSDAFLLGKTSGIISECSCCFRQQPGDGPRSHGYCIDDAGYGSSGPRAANLSLADIEILMLLQA